MAATKYDLTISKGEDFNFALRITDALDQPANLGSSPFGKAEIREADQKPLAATFTVASLGDGTLKLSLTKAQTLALDSNKKYKYDFFWFDADDLYQRLLYGEVSVVPNITNIT